MKKYYFAIAALATILTNAANATCCFNDEVEENYDTPAFLQGPLNVKITFGDYDPQHVDDSALPGLVQNAIKQEKDGVERRKLGSVINQIKSNENKKNNNSNLSDSHRALKEAASLLSSSINIPSSTLSNSNKQRMKVLDNIAKNPNAEKKSHVSRICEKFEKKTLQPRRLKLVDLKHSPFQQSFAYFKNLENLQKR